MTIDPLAFLDEPSEDSSSSQSDPLSFLDESPKGIGFPKIGFGRKERSGESKVPEMRRHLARTGKEVGSTIVGIPGDVVSGTASGLNWIKKQLPFGTPKTDEELSEITENPFTSQALSKKTEDLFPSLAPRNQAEKDEDEMVSLITSLAVPFPGGKGKAINPKSRQLLYQAGKRLGLTEKDLAPLFHKELPQNILAKLSGKSKEAAESLRTTQRSLGNVYDSLKSKPSAANHISGQIASDLGDDLFHFRQSLEKTLASGPDKKAVLKFLEDAHDKVMNHGATPEELINFYQDINKTVNWNALHGGRKQLAKAKEFVSNALAKSDPSLAKDFSHANQLWAKSEAVIKGMGRKKYQDFINAGVTTAIVGALVTGNIDTAKNLALGVAGKKALGKVATKLLTDPKWQYLHTKALNAMKNNSPKAAQVVLQQMREKAEKEMPKEADEIDWDKVLPF